MDDPIIQSLDNKLAELSRLFHEQSRTTSQSDEDAQTAVEGLRPSSEAENTPLISPDTLNNILGKVEGQLNLKAPEPHA